MSKLFTKDASGLSHYHNPGYGTVNQCARKAIRYRPKGPAWFWFNGTFAPILPGDTWETLCQRWHDWRTAYQEDPKQTLELLETFSRLSFVQINRGE